jgi:hypothetical protein
LGGERERDMGPIKCEILLARLSKIYFSSELVLGTVCLTAKTATNISSKTKYL